VLWHQVKAKIELNLTKSAAREAKNENCNWKCGRKTKNHTRLSDLCWADRENIYLARKVKDAAEDKKPLSEAREADLTKARQIRAAKLLKELPGMGFRIEIGITRG
jgi:hypothetical protein